MDKLISQFKTTYPMFYSTYKNNRIIIDPAKSNTQINAEIKNSIDNTPISGALLQVTGKAYTGTTDATGKCILKIPVPGLYSIQISKAGFVSKVVDNIKLTLGQTTSLQAQLDPA
ncbi:MAG: carboxypeptidase regulatory-like domain-containing protein [Bacteroidetes bacterium]|nr:carboxypeptidase regulatory-like domain-containing protein [Bacteroidota bacterium]